MTFGQFLNGLGLRVTAFLRRPLLRVILPVAGLCLGLILQAGCRLPSHLPKFDTGQAGWSQRQYQVVWKADKKANDMVCDVVEGHHPDGRAYLEVSKPPLTLVSVRVADSQWWVEYGPRPRSGSGRVDGPIAHLWVLVATHNTNHADLKMETSATGVTIWKSLSRGEQIEGVPAP